VFCSLALRRYNSGVGRRRSRRWNPARCVGRRRGGADGTRNHQPEPKPAPEIFSPPPFLAVTPQSPLRVRNHLVSCGRMFQRECSFDFPPCSPVRAVVGTIRRQVSPRSRGSFRDGVVAQPDPAVARVQRSAADDATCRDYVWDCEVGQRAIFAAA